MNFKPLALLVLSSSFLAGCNLVPITKPKPKPVVFQDPEPSAPFYALNPTQYDAPPRFEVAIKEAANTPDAGSKLIIPTIDTTEHAMKYATSAGQHELDVTEIDDFLQLVEGKARHYPPHFANSQERRGYQRKLKEVTQTLDTLAQQPNASFDVLTRAFKASVMARNLDMGTAYTTKSLTYAQRILKISPDDPETNFWFGFNLSEGGGQREAIPYFNKAIKGNIQEAYLSATNNYLWLEQKKNAIQTLKNYKTKYPDETEVVDRLIKEIESGKRWNVWQILS